MDNHQHGPNCGCKEFLFNENADDLYASIEIDSVYCLNETIDSNCRKVFRIDEEKLMKDHFVQSETDSEVIVIIPFLETVRIKSINIIAFDENTAANKMKVYLNNENIDFGIIETEPIQEFILSSNLDGDYGCATKLSKFENVNKLALHLSSSVKDPIKISYIGIKGIKTSMKKQLVQTVYELNPLPKEVDPTKNTSTQDVF